MKTALLLSLVVLLALCSSVPLVSGCTHTVQYKTSAFRPISSHAVGNRTEIAGGKLTLFPVSLTSVSAANESIQSISAIVEHLAGLTVLAVYTNVKKPVLVAQAGPIIVDPVSNNGPVEITLSVNQAVELPHAASLLLAIGTNGAFNISSVYSISRNALQTPLHLTASGQLPHKILVYTTIPHFVGAMALNACVQ